MRFCGNSLFENVEQPFQAVILGQRADEGLGFRHFGGQFLQLVKVEIKQAVPLEEIACARDVNRFDLPFPAEFRSEIIQSARCLLRCPGIDYDQDRLVILRKSLDKTLAIFLELQILR